MGDRQVTAEVRARVRQWQSQGFEPSSALARYLAGERPLPEVADVAIHFGSAEWPGAVYHLGEVVVPVAAPALLARLGPIAGAAELGRFTLLQHVTRPEAWQEWLGAFGVDHLEGHVGPRFEQFHMVIQAALAGLGLALLPRFLVHEELVGGRPVVAVDRPVTSRHAYYLVHPEARADLHRAAFRAWLLEQCAAEGTETPP